jgi:hypothetical protein
MSKTATTEGLGDVPRGVFEKFLGELAGAGLPPEVISRLHKTLLDNKVFSERALKEAVFGEESLP